MKYILPDVEGVTLLELSIDMDTHKDEDHVVKIKADTEQWLSPEQCEDFAHALQRIAQRAKQRLNVRDREEQIKTLMEALGKEDDDEELAPPKGKRGGILS